MDKSDLRARTRQLSGAELEGLRTDAEVDTLVVEAYEQIGRLTEWKWREALVEFSTADGTALYDIPAGIAMTQGLRLLDAPGYDLPEPLEEVGLREMLDGASRDDTGIPHFYARQAASKLRLAPTPGAVYTVEVYGQAPLDGLSVDADTPEWDSRWHASIAYLAASVLLEEEGQDELSQARRAKADEMLTDMTDFYQRSHDNAPIVVGGGSGRTGYLARRWPWS